MPKIEPRLYEPADDGRYYEVAEDTDEEGSRLPLLIVVALLVLAAFAAVVWVAYTQGVARGRSGAPEIIAAQPGPVKTAPANPGGAKTPYVGLKVYEQQASADDAGTDTSAPPAQARAPALRTVPDNAATAKKPVAAPSQTPPARQVAKLPPPVAHPATNATATARQTEARPPILSVQPPPAAKPMVRQAETNPSALSPAAQSGGYVLQIGSFKSEAEANAAWGRFKARHAAATAGIAPSIVSVDLGARGTWYRLRMGSYGSQAAAAGSCHKLQAEGASCIPAKS